MIMSIITSLLDAISKIADCKKSAIVNRDNEEVIDDKNKLELAVYHAKKVIQIYEGINIKKSVKLKYHLNKFYKYC